jgi:hypothetical protein
LPQPPPYRAQWHAQVQQSGSRHDDALLAARNILAGEKKYDVWAVNDDGEYLESGAAATQSTSAA